MRYALLILLVAASLSATSSPRAFGHTWVRWIALVPAAEAGGAGWAGEASEEAGAVSRFSREGGRCFVAGTLVWMADGTTKPVEEVKSGDWVLSRDPVTGKVSASQVGPCTERQAGSVEAVTLTDSQSGQSQTLVCSPEHPFYVDGKGFMSAASLGVGTSIVTRAGPSLTVTAVEERHDAKGGYAVYNFVVPGDHTYFVGTLDGGAWVHNPLECDGPTEAFNRDYHYSRTPNTAQKKSVPEGMLFDHDPPLAQHYYEGDGKGGLPGYKMTQTEREAYAARTDVGRAATSEQRFKQGALMRAYGVRMRKQYGLPKFNLPRRMRRQK
jgi:hypothetical protein